MCKQESRVQTGVTVIGCVGHVHQMVGCEQTTGDITDISGISDSGHTHHTPH